MSPTALRRSSARILVAVRVPQALRARDVGEFRHDLSRRKLPGLPGLGENPENYAKAEAFLMIPTSRDRSPGSERRQHRMYVTRNTEYHFRGQICVAVRDRKTGCFLQSHLAVARTLSCGVRYQDNGTAIPSGGPPLVGEALYFSSARDGRELVTSLCSSIERPERDLVAAYPAP
jgi:hypothetical protein